MRSSFVRKMAAIAAMTAAAVAIAEMPRSEWHAKVSECALDVAALKATIAQLSAEDQVAFLAEVNEALGKMPGSNEARAAAVVQANIAALEYAHTNNVDAVLAEVFATAPAEYLPALTERLASDVFSRTADGAQGVSDEQYAELAKDSVAAVAARAGDTDAGAVRATFALLMFQKASGGSPADLAQRLAEALPEAYRSTATETWIPAANSEEGANFDAMLGAARAGDEPDGTIVQNLLGNHNAAQTAILAEMASGRRAGTGPASAFFNPSKTANSFNMSAYGWEDPAMEDLDAVPRGELADPNSPYYSRRRGRTPRGQDYPGTSSRAY
ncbi:MAG: hypothetical protein IJ802_02175 [Kiritimatiellae bacterium]|nr:hypothetical protein [Kiritimatiellia bacterium]